MLGMQIFTLYSLQKAADNKKAVIVPGTVWEKPIPAAFMINLQGYILVRLLTKGMYLYEKPKKENKKWQNID